MSAFVQKKEEFLKFIKNKFLNKEEKFHSSLFYFALNSNSQKRQFRINIDKKCLVLSQYPGAEIKGLGGLIAQYPKNFEILCLTNGSNLVEYCDAIESAGIEKQRFCEVMKSLRVKGYKIFDINSLELDKNYQTFRKIDISEVDYIFIPNIYDDNKDTVSLLKHFKKLLEEKEHKENLKIVMFESDNPLCAPDYLADIEHIIETKRKMLGIYYPNSENLINKIISLNSYRASKYNNIQYLEAFMTFSINDFLNIKLI